MAQSLWTFAHTRHSGVQKSETTFPIHWESHWFCAQNGKGESINYKIYKIVRTPLISFSNSAFFAFCPADGATSPATQTSGTRLHILKVYLYISCWEYLKCESKHLQSSSGKNKREALFKAKVHKDIHSKYYFKERKSIP